ncbi:Hypothetical protein MVR_LOCUS81 [uncultured virus]|nr:Hypothetical protein MVR_LOCUS81 [uncultured virus]
MDLAISHLSLSHNHITPETITYLRTIPSLHIKATISYDHTLSQSYTDTHPLLAKLAANITILEIYNTSKDPSVISRLIGNSSCNTTYPQLIEFNSEGTFDPNTIVTKMPNLTSLRIDRNESTCRLELSSLSNLTKLAVFVSDFAKITLPSPSRLLSCRLAGTTFKSIDVTDATWLTQLVLVNNDNLTRVIGMQFLTNLNDLYIESYDPDDFLLEHTISLQPYYSKSMKQVDVHASLLATLIDYNYMRVTKITNNTSYLAKVSKLSIIEASSDVGGANPVTVQYISELFSQITPSQYKSIEAKYNIDEVIRQTMTPTLRFKMATYSNISRLYLVSMIQLLHVLLYKFEMLHQADVNSNPFIITEALNILVANIAAYKSDHAAVIEAILDHWLPLLKN